MIRFLAYLVILGTAAAGIAWLAARPGEVTVLWQGWRIDTSVGALAAFTVLVGMAMALLYRFWRAVVTLPRRFARWRRDRRQCQGFDALSSGLVAVAAGDADGARRMARRADRLLDRPALTLLLAAQAAQLTGDEDTAQRHFAAMLERPETEFLGLRGLLARAIRDGDLPRALDLARRAQALRPKTPWVLTTLFDLQTRAGDWPGAIDTLSAMRRAKALPPAEQQRREAAILLELSRTAIGDGRNEDALRHAKKAYRVDPEHPATAAWLAGRYAATGRRRRAARLVEREWTRLPHPALLAAYREARQAETPLIWVKEAERLAALAPAHVESHRVLGEASFEARLWGEARRHYTAAIAGWGDTPPASLCRRMAEIEEADSGDDAAARRWLTLAAEAQPDPAWICGTCGAPHAAWHAACGRCHSFGQLAWRLPDRVLPAHVAATARPALAAGSEKETLSSA